MSNPHPLRVAVIGGGISGLAAAHRITELDPSAEVHLFEAGARLGGTLRTTHRDGYLIEDGAENFITTMPWGIDFCRRIGFEEELIPTSGPHRRAFVVRDGKLRAIPEGFMLMAPGRIWPVLTTRILTPVGKIRLASELLIPKRGNGEDESLASFVTRRMGRETYERLVQPLISGIYTADPEKLSLASTMPQFLKMEQEHGSLIRAMWAKKKTHNETREKEQASGARYGQFVAPRRGMSAFIEAIEKRLEGVTSNLQTTVEGISQNPTDGQWSVRVDGSRQLTVDALVLATPAHCTSRLLRDLDEPLANLLNEIEYASSALITMGYKRSQIRHPLDGFGFVVPLAERRSVLSASFSSIKYAGRAPNKSVLIRVYIGGACQPELLEMDDSEIIDVAQQELRDLLGIQGEPQLQNLHRCRQAMPQYHVGHASLVQQVMTHAERYTGLALAGNWIRGVGIPHCIHSAESSVERVLSSSSPTTRDGALPLT